MYTTHTNIQIQRNVLKRIGRFLFQKLQQSFVLIEARVLKRTQQYRDANTAKKKVEHITLTPFTFELIHKFHTFFAHDASWNRLM